MGCHHLKWLSWHKLHILIKNEHDSNGFVWIKARANIFYSILIYLYLAERMRGKIEIKKKIGFFHWHYRVVAPPRKIYLLYHLFTNFSYKTFSMFPQGSNSINYFLSFQTKISHFRNLHAEPNFASICSSKQKCNNSIFNGKL